MSAVSLSLSRFPFECCDHLYIKNSPPFALFALFFFFYCMSFHKMSRIMSIDAIVTPSTPPPEEPFSPPDSILNDDSSSSPVLMSMLAPLSNKSRYLDHKTNHSHTSSASVEERRYRNKIASAKYRAKKQASMRAMAERLAQMCEQNKLLQQDLVRAEQENETLRQLCSSLMVKLSSSSSSSPPVSPSLTPHSSSSSYC